MPLKETIKTEYKNALKSKDKTKISTYRLILSSIKDLDILNRSGPNKKDTDDEDIKKLLKKMIKRQSFDIIFFYLCLMIYYINSKIQWFLINWCCKSIITNRKYLISFSYSCYSL